MRLRAFRREAYDWAEITGGQEDRGPVADDYESDIIDFTSPGSHGSPRSVEVTPPRRVEMDQRTRENILVRTDLDEGKGRPWTPPGYDASRNYGGKDPDLQR